MNTSHQSADVWQQPAWPLWRYDLTALSAPLSQARLAQGTVIGKAQAIGLSSGDLGRITEEIWINEVVATAAIEGEKLNLEMVRSSVMRKLGSDHTGPSSRHIDGLVDVMNDATQNYQAPAHCRTPVSLAVGTVPGRDFRIKTH